MDESMVPLLRHIFQHHIKLHPIWDQENRRALEKLFGLDDEELDALHKFAMWVCNHGLERLTT